jgi:hypothetical protein
LGYQQTTKIKITKTGERFMYELGTERMHTYNIILKEKKYQQVICNMMFSPPISTVYRIRSGAFNLLFYFMVRESCFKTNKKGKQPTKRFGRGTVQVTSAL